MPALDLSVASTTTRDYPPPPSSLYIYFRLENFYKLSVVLVNQGGNREIEVASRAKFTTARGRGATIDAAHERTLTYGVNEVTPIYSRRGFDSPRIENERSGFKGYRSRVWRDSCSVSCRLSNRVRFFLSFSARISWRRRRVAASG